MAMSKFSREYFVQQGKRGARKRWAGVSDEDKAKATKAATEARAAKRLAKAQQIVKAQAAKRNGGGG